MSQLHKRRWPLVIILQIGIAIMLPRSAFAEIISPDLSKVLRSAPSGRRSMPRGISGIRSNSPACSPTM